MASWGAQVVSFPQADSSVDPVFGTGTLSIVPRESLMAHTIFHIHLLILLLLCLLFHLPL